ncbi:Protein GLUTAMINE DUMPER 2 [Castilleja foliolosa]|uniref:Protein GLUTAMINE DUMPER 2 n=1 Tax=Castilleja foliolosa TaxID=1961234 RepID=A0ABD3CK55_9LAMI
MRNAAVLIHSTPLSKMATAAATTAAKAIFTPAPATVQRSPWHSPVPYLFGGLAAMLGLIAFALLILACSYWNASTGPERDVEAGKGEGGSDAKAPPVFDDKFLVIMAGDVNPTFLATPMINSKTSFLNDEKEKEEKVNEKDVTSQQNGDGGY